MTRSVIAALAGIAFGFLISWGQFTDPDRIRDMLLLEDLYLYGMMGTAVLVAGLGVRLLLRRGAHSPLTGERIQLTRRAPSRQVLAGAAIFGVGWAVASSCPAPIVGQLAQGVWWSLATASGVLLGVAVYLRSTTIA